MQKSKKIHKLLYIMKNGYCYDSGTQLNQLLPNTT
jgi:hypothetical protein